MPVLKFTPPAEFVEEELMTTWRVPYVPDLKEPRMLQRQMPVRPNLVVHRRTVGEKDLADVTASVCDQLMKSIDGLSKIATSELVFKDGVSGMLLEYSFPAVGSYEVVQLHAMRLDGEVLTSLTLCTEGSRITPEVHRQYRECLSSATVG